MGITGKASVMDVARQVREKLEIVKACIPTFMPGSDQARAIVDCVDDLALCVVALGHAVNNLEGSSDAGMQG